MPHRRQQIESTLHRAIGTILARGLADPRIRGLVSVTRVELSQDLRRADVFVSVIPDKYARRTLAGLRAAHGRIQAQVAAAVTLRAMPRLEFRLDEGVKKEAAVFDAISRGLAREGLDPHDVQHADEAEPQAGDDAEPRGSAT